MRRFALAAITVGLTLAACTSPARTSSAPPPSTTTAPAPTPAPTPARDAPAIARDRAHALAAALRGHDVTALIAIADPTVGLTFWSQPGAYPRPGPAVTTASNRVPEEPYPGYFGELADLLDAGAAIATVDAPPYEVPSEDVINEAPPWATVRTREVDLLRFAPDPDDRARVRDHHPRYELHVERGYRVVHVYFSEHGSELRVTDAMIWSHYDA